MSVSGKARTSPLEAALLAYHSGNPDASFVIRRNDGFKQTVPVRIFFDDGLFPEIEKHALSLCRGDILDVGAAAGRHSLALHRRGLNVWSLDILPQAVRIMSERGVSRPMVGNILEWSGQSFDTVLMLMNGIGMVGNPGGLDHFLNHAHKLVKPGGHILCDSVDVAITTDPMHIAYREENEKRDLAPGQQQFMIIHDNFVGEPFAWLHIDFRSLAAHAEKAGWNCALVCEDADGRYLAQLTRSED